MVCQLQLWKTLVLFACVMKHLYILHTTILFNSLTPWSVAKRISKQQDHYGSIIQVPNGSTWNTSHTRLSHFRSGRACVWSQWCRQRRHWRPQSDPCHLGPLAGAGVYPGAKTAICRAIDSQIYLCPNEAWNCQNEPLVTRRFHFFPHKRSQNKNIHDVMHRFLKKTALTFKCTLLFQKIRKSPAIQAAFGGAKTDHWKWWPNLNLMCQWNKKKLGWPKVEGRSQKERVKKKPIKWMEISQYQPYQRREMEKMENGRQWAKKDFNTRRKWLQVKQDGEKSPKKTGVFWSWCVATFVVVAAAANNLNKVLLQSLLDGSSRHEIGQSIEASPGSIRGAMVKRD